MKVLLAAFPASAAVQVPPPPAGALKFKGVDGTADFAALQRSTLALFTETPD